MFKQCEDNHNCKTWLALVKHEIFSLGLGDYWADQNTMNTKLFLYVMKKRVLDQFKQNLDAYLEMCSRASVYRHLVNTVELQHYFHKNIPLKFR